MGGESGRYTHMPSVERSSLRRRVVRIALSALCVTIGFGSMPADAAPTPDAGDPTQGFSAEHIEAVAERYNLARVNVDRARAALENTEQRIKAAEVSTKLVQIRVRARARAMYTGVGTVPPLPLESGALLADRDRRTTYLDAAQKPDQALVRQLSHELGRLRTARESQRAARDLLDRNLASARAMKNRLETLAAQAAREATTTPTGDGAGPIASSQPPSAAASPVAAGTGTPTTAPTTPSTTAPRPSTPAPTPAPAPAPTPAPAPPTPTSPAPSNAPAPSSGAATAIAFARAQLGKPYAFATAGPNTFDCSGLTKAAWAAAGVRMPHYSGSQATMFARVSYAELQPGDIVVFYSDLHHVGLYIGGGMMIHAPQTGDVVKISPAWRTTFQWGVRPR